MPYIQQDLRKILDPHIDGLLDAIIDDLDIDPENIGGIYNYIISRLLEDAATDSMCYATVERLVGMLECCKMELYRRVIGPYEDTKIAANGDVY